MHLKVKISTLLIFLLVRNCYSQGCNDAGLCTMGEIRQGSQLDSGKFGFSSTLIYRLGERNSSNLALQAGGIFHLWKSGKVSLQLSLQIIIGNLGFVTGVGDVSVDLTQNLLNRDSTRISITFGSKLPANKANLSKNNSPLPMAYQTSQGTWDAIFAVNLFYKMWRMSLGIQHNWNSNGNKYIDSLKGDSRAAKYFNSRKIDRGDDILLRIEKVFYGKENSKYFLSILPIYRLQEATIEIPSGERVSINGSSGLTINLNVGYIHEFGKKSSYHFFAGAPVLTRHIRPDGLTGTFVLGFSVNWLQ